MWPPAIYVSNAAAPGANAVEHCNMHDDYVNFGGL
jgi:hypothetical protein